MSVIRQMNNFRPSGQAEGRQGEDELAALGTCFAQDAAMANSLVSVG